MQLVDAALSESEMLVDAVGGDDRHHRVDSATPAMRHRCGRGPGCQGDGLVSGKTSAVVAGESAGSKLDKAESWACRSSPRSPSTARTSARRRAARMRPWPTSPANRCSTSPTCPPGADRRGNLLHRPTIRDRRSRRTDRRSRGRHPPDLAPGSHDQRLPRGRGPPRFGSCGCAGRAPCGKTTASARAFWMRTDSVGDLQADLVRQDAATLSSALSAGDITSVELTQACLIESRRSTDDPRVLYVDTDAALATAQDVIVVAAVKSFVAPPGFLALKDVLGQWGSRPPVDPHPRGLAPPYDSTIAERLRAADVVILGKTNMDEFAMGSSTEHSGAARPATCGMSSAFWGSGGGSAAARGVGGAPGHRHRTGGSIRQPASVTGTVGVKPT